MTETVTSVARGDLNVWWRVGIPLVLPIERALFRVRVGGIHHVPLEGPAILAFVHISVLDGPCLAIEVAWRRRRAVRFLVAAEVFDHPVSGWVLRRFRQIPIRRGRSDAGALDDAIATIRRGALAAIAPEGAANPSPGELQRIRSGIARIAMPTGAPVIPVGIWGTHGRWSKSGRHWGRPWRPRLGLAFGEPIEPTGDVSYAEDIDSFLERVREGLERQLSAARILAGDPQPD
ncbi:MAG TPA: lysophospholipid acyltransferase family protein [Actinomycetota bacterium]|nr:lysophospholipid acyltransferase family protein [Actinomycetota bacterium]